MPVLQSMLWREHMCVITFYATPEFPSSNCSYDMQIWPLSSAPCLTQLFVSPCTDPSTRPHIQESDVLVTCRLNFWYYYFPFWVFALWNVVPSRPFSPCSWFDPPNLSRWVRLFLSIYNCSLPVLMCPLTNNLVDPSPGLSCSELPYFTWIYFHRIFNRPLPQPVQILLQLFHVFIIYNFAIDYTVISKKSNSWLSIPPNIIYVG